MEVGARIVLGNKEEATVVRAADRSSMAIVTDDYSVNHCSGVVIEKRIAGPGTWLSYIHLFKYTFLPNLRTVALTTGGMFLLQSLFFVTVLSHGDGSVPLDTAVYKDFNARSMPAYERCMLKQTNVTMEKAVAGVDRWWGGTFLDSVNLHALSWIGLL